MKLLQNVWRSLLALSLLSGISIMANAESVEIDGLIYELNATKRSAAVTSYNAESLSANVVIPSTVQYSGNSYDVTTINNGAFKNFATMESISIPGSVVQIGVVTDVESNLPFYGCSSLKVVRFEDGETPLKLCHYYKYTYQSSPEFIAKGLFGGMALEEVYIGRNIRYLPYESIEKMGYSAFYSCPKLVKVTVGEKVTDIPSYLFYRNYQLTILELPKVETIGSYAFAECSRLATVGMGSMLKAVGNRSFYQCENITKLTFPHTLETIGESAFYKCTSVTEISVGNSLKSIGASAFEGCSSFTAVILPDGFTTMGESAFEDCTKLTVVQLGNSLTSIPADAFRNCVSLSEMVVPATVESIGDRAFYNDSGLAVITMNEGLKTIGSEVFWNNSGLTRLQFPGSVLSIGRSSFTGCRRLTYLIFQDGPGELTLDNMGSYSLAGGNKVEVQFNYFYDCPIRSLTLGRNLKYAYNKNILVAGKSSPSAPFVCKTDLKSVKIGRYVTYLWHHLFHGCSNLKEIVMPDGLRQVYSYAFADCTGLTELIFPNYLVLLDDSACAGDTQLETVVFNEEPGNNLKFSIGTYTFQNCPGLTSLTFPAKTVSIGNYCFYETPNLKNISFVDSDKEISLGYGAKADAYQGDKNGNMPLFGNSKLNTLYIGRNISYITKSSASTEKERGMYGFSPFYNQSFLTDVRFSQTGTVTYCLDHLLYKVNNCEELILPESLKTIGNWTFSGMTLLNGITIPNMVTEIGKYAFAEDENLKYAKLSTSCPWLKEGLFSNCRTLTSITIPPVVTKMDSYMFNGCVSLATATFEGSSELIEMGNGIGGGLFNTSPLVTLNLDRWLKYSSSPFSYIAELKNLNLGENVKVIDKYMFSHCTGLEEVNLPDHIESVGLESFRGCTALKNVHLSANLSQISDYGFAECTVLDNVVFPDKMTSVSDHGFADCVSLTNLDLGNSLNIIGPAAFKNCVKLNGITIPETLYGLGVEAFANCTSLPNVTIRSITSVGRQAFEGCTGLRWVSLSDKTTSVGENSFAGCTGIGYVKSYAEFPPEGLVNFVESVPENGTLFVPENSIDYYAESPTWENWKDIRPLNDNVMVSSVTLDKTEYSFKAAETVRLTATVGAENATDKAVVWRSADETVATVDETGTVTAAGVGETIVSAVAADGSGEKGECRITVVPTPVASIAIASDVTAMKKGRTMSLAATVSPATATEKGLRWSSSDISVAVVNSEGVVTTKLPGAVTITAAATDGSEVTSTFELTVLPLTKGDSNDNDELTITDAVNTANYAVGNEVANFCVEAADVNGDNRITLADASGTVTLVLEQPMVTAARKMRDALSGAGNAADCLVADDYDATPGRTSVIGVRLDNSIDYVALQGDIILPEGMVIEDIAAGARVAGTHALAVRRVDDRRARVALFALDNAAFADTDGSLFDMTVRVGDNVSGNIGISNIVAADAGACEYILTSAGGYRAGTSGVDSISYTDLRIEAGEGVIRISNAAGKEISVFAADGTLLSRFTAREELETRRLTPGVYVVTAAEKSFKVMVK